MNLIVANTFVLLVLYQLLILLQCSPRDLKYIQNHNVDAQLESKEEAYLEKISLKEVKNLFPVFSDNDFGNL